MDKKHASTKHIEEPKAGALWEWKDGSAWKPFHPPDNGFLEKQYKIYGPKGTFVSTNFVFNAGYNTEYEINFESMVQKNLSSKKVRPLRRKDAAAAAKAPKWEWRTNQKTWAAYAEADAELLEKAYNAGTTPFETKELSFNKGFDSLYIFDFAVMTQVNCDSGTSRKIQRIAVGGSKSVGHNTGEDDAYAGLLLHGMAAGGKGKAVGAMFKLGLDPAFIDIQKKRGAQSLRKRVKDYGPAVNKDAHGTMCFDSMLSNEKEFCGEWVVFYHSYSSAAILYEVQAAVASVLFRYKAEFAGLPRILAKGFKHIPDAAKMLAEFPKWPDRDHNPAFKAVGLCATSSLLAPDAEAPAKSVFLMGYSVGNLAGVLEKLLSSVGVPAAKVKTVGSAVIDLASKYGLDTSGIPGGQACKSGRSGHMLQIFLRRELCDKYVYPAHPYGVPDKARNLPLSKYLAEKDAIEGQVRITLNPDVFLRATYARMFTFSADPTYHTNRPAFIKELVQLLDPILGEDSVRIKAAQGIFDGEPPEWWSPEDQSEMAAMSASRYASSSMAEEVADCDHWG